MGISYDPAKNARNIASRGISFDRAREFEWSSALVIEDVRHDYGEVRFRAMGFVDERQHVLVFTPCGDKVHVISLRKANRQEIKRYEEKIKS